MNLTIFLSSYFLIILSIIGYGLILQNLFIKKIKLEFEFVLLGTILFLIIISFFSHFFTSHNYFHNTIILVVGLIFFLISTIKNRTPINEYLKYLLLIFIILIFGLLAAKMHDDFSYYHFPYTYYLTQEKLIVGTGGLNHGFRTPSSIFYLNSLFYLPFIKYFSFNIGAIIIFGVSNLILIFKLINDYKNKKNDFIFILTLLSFLFINIFFYRISEHGTDRSAQILIFILFIEILYLIRKKVNLKSFFSKIFILLGLIISLKAFYVLYLLTLVPIFIFLKNKNFKKLKASFLKNFFFYLFLLVGIFLILINIFNSGCLLYPLDFTCFSMFEWSLKNEARAMNDWYQQWSKAGAGPNYRVDDPENYIKGFNWVGNWIDRYFFNKVSDFILGILFLLTIVFFVFNSKKIKKITIDKKIFSIYIIIFILFIEWFYNHPSLRYGGFSLIALILFIPSSIYISRFIQNKNFKIKIISLIICSLIIFIGRNVDRIYDEKNKYEYHFIKKPFYNVDEKHFRIQNYIGEIIQNHIDCKKKNLLTCDNNNEILVKEKNNYLFLIRKK